MTRSRKEQDKLGKVSRLFTIHKTSDKKVKQKVVEERKKVKGKAVLKVTNSSVVDRLIQDNL